MAPKDTKGRRPSKSDDDPKPILNEVGEQILAAVESVARSAQSALAEGPSGVSRDSLIRPSNMMVGDANPEKTIHAKNAEERAALRRLLDEPLVARVDVDWSKEGGSVQTIYFPRRWTGGISVPGVQFVSSYAALGQLAEYEAGETATIDVNGQTRTARILKQVLLVPNRKDGQWDALVSDFGIVPWGDVLRLLGSESLRDAIATFVRDLKGPVPLRMCRAAYSRSCRCGFPAATNKAQGRRPYRATRPTNPRQVPRPDLPAAARPASHSLWPAGFGKDHDAYKAPGAKANAGSTHRT